MATEQVSTYRLLDTVSTLAWRVNVARKITTVEDPSPAISALLRCIEDTLRELNRYDMLRLRGLRSTFNTVADYTTGTVAVTQGSKTVTGTSTVFTSGMVGRAFSTTGENSLYRIASFTSATSVTLDANWAEDTATGASYVIAQDRYTAPTNLKELKWAGIQGPYAKDLDIRSQQEQDHDRYTYRRSLIAVDDPVSIGIDPERTSDGSLQFRVEPFPDEIYRIDFVYDGKVTRLVHDTDVVPVEDDNIGIVWEGAEARWWDMNGQKGSWLTFTNTRLKEFIATNVKPTDKVTQLVPADVMRTPRVRYHGKQDWKDR